MWVACYPEDETPERIAAIDRANGRLQELQRRVQEKGPRQVR
jgi:hypothetical protein